MRKLIVLSVICEKNVNDISQLIAQRAWTIDGVKSVEVAHEFPSAHEPRPTPVHVPENVWAELPHIPKISFAKTFESIFAGIFGRK